MDCFVRRGIDQSPPRVPGVVTWNAERVLPRRESYVAWGSSIILIIVSLILIFLAMDIEADSVPSILRRDSQHSISV
jgi:hypothetical protein